MSAGIFEVLAADESEARLGSRKALLLANTRIGQRLGRFLGQAKSPQEFDARYELVREDFEGIVAGAVEDAGFGDSTRLTQTIRTHYRQACSPAQKKEKAAMEDEYGEEKGEDVFYATENKKKKSKSDRPFGGSEESEGGKCPLCKGTLTKAGDCPQCKSSAVHESEKWIQKATEKPGFEEGGLHRALDVPEDEKIPEDKIEDAEEHGGKNLKEKAQFAENVKGKKSQWAKQASREVLAELDGQIEKLARRPKMCPYHSEVVDIALATGNPQAGYETMQSHAWSPNHCQGEWEGGSCKFKTGMVNQSYWDERQQQLDEKREIRQQQGLDNVVDFPTDEQHGDFEPDHIDLENPEVIDFPSDSEGGESPVAEPVADTPLAVAEARIARVAAEGAGDKDTSDKKTESLPDANEDSTTGLGKEPSPKMDKGPARKPGDQGWSLSPIDVPSKRHPTEQIDATKALERLNVKDKVKGDVKGIGEQTTETVDLPSEKEDAGFQTGGEDFGPNTKTWSGEGREESPVTKDHPLDTVTSRMRWAIVNPAAPGGHGGGWECPQCGTHNVNSPYCVNCQAGQPQGAGQLPGRAEWSPDQMTPAGV